MKLYFVRHGQTDSNASASNNPSSGDDEPLNTLGIEQSNILAEELKDVKFDAIISSTMNRCVQTADILNKYHHMEIKQDPAWKEINTGGYIDITRWADLCTFGTEVSKSNIEPLETFFNRVYLALDRLILESKDKTVLLVSSGGVQHAVYAYANNLPLKGNMRISPMKNCELRIYNF